MRERELKLMENDVVLEALYLDRRLNVLLNAEQCHKARALLKEVHLQSRSLRIRDTTQLSEQPDMELNQNTTESAPSTSNNLSLVEAILQRRDRERGSTMQNQSFDICLQDICVAPRINLNENIITHWHNKAALSSDIAIVANIVLGAPATQVSVERLFSSLKFVLHPLRSNISSIFLKDLMLIRENKDLI